LKRASSTVTFEQNSVEEKSMNIFRKNRSARSLMKAAGLGLALAVLLSLIVIFTGAISDVPAARQAGDSIGTSAIVPTATAAVPATDMLAATPPLVAGADSGLDEFRLDRDSCCINHY
jgi:hypothetical protein